MRKTTLVKYVLIVGGLIAWGAFCWIKIPQYQAENRAKETKLRMQIQQEHDRNYVDIIDSEGNIHSIPESEYEDFMTDELEYILKSIKKDRGFQTSECMCVISSENYEDVEEYDNVFLDNTVIRSDDMFDSEEFWTENGSIIKAIKYIKLNYA